MSFLNFSSTVNFSYQYPPEAKVYLELSRTSTTEFFREKLFRKIYKKTPVLESLFIEVTGLYSATSLKGLQHRFFLMNLVRYLRHLFYRTPPDDCFCSTEK